MPYPLTHIKDMINKISNFNYATTLYLIMGYYNILLTDAAKKYAQLLHYLGSTNTIV